jgi:cytochrome c biogenesis protein CcdA
MAIEASLPTALTVIITALVDSINPCAIGVLILLISVMLATRQSRSKMFLLSVLYIGTVGVIYFIAGFGLVQFLHKIPLVWTMILSIIAALVLVIGGLIEMKDCFWYGQGVSLHIPARAVKTIHKMSKKITIFGVIFLGVFVAAVELPCTGGPYLAIILLLSQNFDFTAVMLLALYNLIFILPLIVIVGIVLLGGKVYNVKKWKMKYRGWMRLAIGLVLILLAWLLIFIANGRINLG